MKVKVEHEKAKVGQGEKEISGSSPSPARGPLEEAPPLGGQAMPQRHG